MNSSSDKETFQGFVVKREGWTVGGHTFDLTWPEDMDVLLDDPETQRRFDADGYMPYWALPWPSSAMLAEKILAGEPGMHRSAVEIGCGIGLVSLAAAKMGWSVTASDYDEDALAFVALNAERNQLTLAGIERIDYRQPLPEPRYDRIFAADLLYERRNLQPVATWIASALNPGGTALLSDPNRTAAEGFIDEAKKLGLKLETERVQTTAPAGLLSRGRIWRVRWA